MVNQEQRDESPRGRAACDSTGPAQRLRPSRKMTLLLIVLLIPTAIDFAIRYPPLNQTERQLLGTWEVTDEDVPSLLYLRTTLIYLNSDRAGKSTELPDLNWRKSTTQLLSGFRQSGVSLRALLTVCEIGTASKLFHSTGWRNS